MPKNGSGQNRKISGAFLTLFTATAAVMLGLGIIIPILPLYAKQMGASGLMIGIIFAAFALTRGFLSPVMGRISDRYGRKRILGTGLLLYSILSLGYAFSSIPETVAGLRLVQGLASAMVTPIAQSYIGDITPKGKEGEYMNLFFISFMGGMAAGPLIGGYLSDALFIEAPFYAMACVSGVSLALVVWRLPQVSVEGGNRYGSIKETFEAVSKDENMRGVITYLGSRGFYRWGFNSFFPVFAATVAAISRTGIGIVISSYMIVGGVLQYPLGKAYDKYSSRSTSFVAIGGAFAALTMFLIPWLRELSSLICLVLAMGVFSAISRSATLGIRTERGRIHGMGAVTGASTASMSIGQVIGPLAFGAVVDSFGITSAFSLGGVVGMGGVIFSCWFLEQGKST